MDIGNRRVGFTNLDIPGGTTTLTLNGAMDCPTHVAEENRAACG